MKSEYEKLRDFAFGHNGKAIRQAGKVLGMRDGLAAKLADPNRPDLSDVEMLELYKTLRQTMTPDEIIAEIDEVWG